MNKRCRITVAKFVDLARLPAGIRACVSWFSTDRRLCSPLYARGMDILARRLYNGGFNHLKRRTGSLLVRIPRSITQPPLVRQMSLPHNAPLVNTDVRSLFFRTAPGVLRVALEAAAWLACEIYACANATPRSSHEQPPCHML